MWNLDHDEFPLNPPSISLGAIGLELSKYEQQ